MRVIVWNEHRHEREDDRVRAVYPEGIHAVLAAAVRERHPDADVGVATLDDPEHGLPEDRLAVTDALVWWGHVAHDEVDPEVAERVRRHVLGGMGLVVLHSGHLSRPFRLLMGTTCHLRWREADDREILWAVAPAHPVVDGVDVPVVLEPHEMYGEPFDVPPPDELVLVSWFSGGEVFRSGCGWRRGAGRVFYLGPGHETHPVYRDPSVRRLVANAVGHVAARGPRRALPERSPHAPAGWYERR